MCWDTFNPIPDFHDFSQEQDKTVNKQKSSPMKLHVLTKQMFTSDFLAEGLKKMVGSLFPSNFAFSVVYKGFQQNINHPIIIRKDIYFRH